MSQSGAPGVSKLIPLGYSCLVGASLSWKWLLLVLSQGEIKSIADQPGSAATYEYVCFELPALHFPHL